MRYYIVDDDPSVVEILKILVARGGGELAGSAYNGQDALDDLECTPADIVLVDLLMPELDGIQFVAKARQRHPDLHFVMLSQVADKEMVAGAYESGIDFYIQKPINGIEVQKVLQKVEKERIMQGTFSQMQSLLAGGLPSPGPVLSAPPQGDYFAAKVDAVLNSLGIRADMAAKEIRQMAVYLHAHPDEEPTVNELCVLFSQSPKTTEQRIRRAISASLVNLAHRGLEDYADETFAEYSGRLFKFEQVRREMEYLRRGEGPRGRVSVRQFLYALAALN